MLSRSALGIALALTLLTACESKKTAAQQAAEDAHAVAMVEAAQNVKPPPAPLDPQPITAADIEANGIYGAGCSLVPVNVPGGDPVVMANERRALVKIGGKFVTFAADPGSATLVAGVRTHYVAKAQSLVLQHGPGTGTALGQDGMRWDGGVAIRDAHDQPVYESAGILTCGG